MLDYNQEMLKQVSGDLLLQLQIVLLISDVVHASELVVTVVVW